MDYNALLDDLYAGTTDSIRLSGFLDRLSLATRSVTTVLIREDPGNPARNLFIARGVDPALRARYDSDTDAPDDKLWFLRSAHIMRTGVISNGEEWATSSEVRGTRYYATVLKEMETQHSAALCGMLTRERAMFLTPCRSSRAGPYGEEEMALFRQIGPHWANACLLMRRFEQLEAQASTPRRRHCGLFLLDADMRWLSGNEAAERMVATGWLGGRRGSRLVSRSPVTLAAWEAAQRRLATGCRKPAAQAIPIYSRSTLVAFASLQAYGTDASCDTRNRFVLFVRPLDPDGDAELAAQLQALFGLTPGEALLSVALRRNGGLQPAARALKLTDGSARTRLQSVYEKTTMHKQSHLVRMLDALADAIA